jgi:nitrous oxidase accessory protein
VGFAKGDALKEPRIAGGKPGLAALVAGGLRIATLAFAANLHAATLQEQIDAESPGATIELKPGEYAGPLVIAKPLTLRGQTGVTIRGDGKTHVIHIRADDVTVSGFHIRGSGLELGKDHAGVFVEGSRATIRENLITNSLHGIYLKKAADCVVAGNRIFGKAGATVRGDQIAAEAIRPGGSDLCELPLNQNARGNGIHLWNSERINVVKNEIRDTRDGIYFTFTNHSYIAGNIVSHTRIGLHYMYSDQNVFEGNRFSENAVGSAIMISKGLVVRGNTFEANVGQRGYGLLLAEVDGTRLEGNAMIGNSIGAFMQLSSGNTFSGNTFARSYIGVRLDGSSDSNTFSRNRFDGNMHPVEIDASLGRNAWSDRRTGNQWGNSAEVDLDGDGVGDLPHRETDLLGELRRPFPIVALLSGSPALDLAGFAQQHASLPGVAAVIDPHPLAAARHGEHAAKAALGRARRPFLAQIFTRLFNQ